MYPEKCQLDCMILQSAIFDSTCTTTVVLATSHQRPFFQESASRWWEARPVTASMRRVCFTALLIGDRKHICCVRNLLASHKCSLQEQDKEDSKQERLRQAHSSGGRGPLAFCLWLPRPCEIDRHLFEMQPQMQMRYNNNYSKISPVSTPLEWLSSSRDLDLDLGLGHTAYRHASLIDLYVHTKFHWNRKTFCGWTFGRKYVDVHTDVPTDGHFRPPLMFLVWLGEVDLTMCNNCTKRSSR